MGDALSVGGELVTDCVGGVCKLIGSIPTPGGKYNFGDRLRHVGKKIADVKAVKDLGKGVGHVAHGALHTLHEAASVCSNNNIILPVQGKDENGENKMVEVLSTDDLTKKVGQDMALGICNSLAFKVIMIAAQAAV